MKVLVDRELLEKCRVRIVHVEDCPAIDGKICNCGTSDAADAIDAALSEGPVTHVVVPVEALMGQWDDFCSAAGVQVQFDSFLRGYKAILTATRKPSSRT